MNAALDLFPETINPSSAPVIFQSEDLCNSTSRTVSATPLTVTHTRLEGRSRPMACPAVVMTASAQHRPSARFAGPSHQSKENAAVYSPSHAGFCGTGARVSRLHKQDRS